MSFQPEPNQTILIDDTNYYFAEHPSAPGVAYGQEGRAGTVFQLAADGYSPKALKVFKNRFRSPALVTQSDRLQAFARLAGLQVCQRSILTPQRHSALLATEPDLTYAALMPWITGPTWHDVLSEKQPLTSQQCLLLAHAFTSALAAMEQEGVAHCDLSGANLLLPALAAGMPPGASPIEFVDVEGLYGPGLVQPRAVPSGSSGYAHRTAEAGLWDVDADRFAGAVLLAEMLAWCDPVVREAAWGESLFDPAELQSDTQRYQAVVEALRRMYGVRVVNLLTQAWNSDTLDGCPTFGEWMVAIPQTTVSDIPFSQPQKNGGDTEVDAVASGEQVATGLMKAASEMEKAGQVDAAKAIYLQALALLPQQSSAAWEIQKILHTLSSVSMSSTEKRPLIPEEKNDQIFDRLISSIKGAINDGNLLRFRYLLTELIGIDPGAKVNGYSANEMLAELRCFGIKGIFRWPVFWWFLLASFVGVAAVLVGGVLGGSIYSDEWFTVILICQGPIILGLSQWWVIRKFVPGAYWWIPTVIINWFLVLANIRWDFLVSYMNEYRVSLIIEVLWRIVPIILMQIVLSWIQIWVLGKNNYQSAVWSILNVPFLLTVCMIIFGRTRYLLIRQIFVPEWIITSVPLYLIFSSFFVCRLLKLRSFHQAN